MSFKTFSEQRWLQYRSTIFLRKPPHPIDWDRARLRIEQAIRTYSEVEEQRELRWLSVAQSHDIQKARELRGALRDQLMKLKEQSPSAPTLRNPPSLHEVDDYIGNLENDQTSWHVPDGGSKRRSYETLRNALLFIWQDEFHGRLRYSKGVSPTPAGPLIRFLQLALVDALGERAAPKTHGIRAMVEQARERRLRRPSRKKR
jgi:hypothetical protein